MEIAESFIKEILQEYGIKFGDTFDEKSYRMLNFTVNNFLIPQSELTLIMKPYEHAKRENKKYFDTSLCFAIVKKITEFLSGVIFIKPGNGQSVTIGLIIKLDKMEQKK